LHHLYDRQTLIRGLFGRRAGFGVVPETSGQIKTVLLVARMQIEADKSLGSASTPSSSSSSALARSNDAPHQTE
jgi:hypothetical protein